MENCASVVKLGVSLINLDQFAKKHGLKKIKDGDFEHEDKFKVLRFYSIQLPATYVIGFQGYKSDDTRFAEVLETWASDKIDKEGIALTWFPCVIVASGVFAVRNADIYAANERKLCWVGVDYCPMGIFIRHLLYRLMMKIPTLPDGFGVIPSYQEYYMKMRRFDATRDLFNIDELPPSKA